MMALRINPTLPLRRIRTDIDRAFAGFFEDFDPRPAFGFHGRASFPALNMWEDEENLYAEAEVPGLKMEDIDVSVLGNELSIKGERKDASEEDMTYHRRERGVGAFSRVIHLPIDVDAESVQATLRDGVLKVTLPKAQSVLPRKIEGKRVD